jgi:DNA-binding transcriptional LysR family regulator
MDRDLLIHLPVIHCVARHRAFAAAAAELGMSPSAVSHAVRSVEDRLATPLFARTTRSVSLTEAGARFVAGIEPALADIGKAVEGLTAERGQVTGLLGIIAPRVVLEMPLTRILAKLARQHPRLTVEVRIGQESVDIVARRFDAGIDLRRAIQQDMVTTRLTGPLKVGLVASRDHLDARGTPKSIADLHQHNCIGIRHLESGGI